MVHSIAPPKPQYSIVYKSTPTRHYSDFIYTHTETWSRLNDPNHSLGGFFQRKEYHNYHIHKYINRIESAEFQFSFPTLILLIVVQYLKRGPLHFNKSNHFFFLATSPITLNTSFGSHLVMANVWVTWPWVPHMCQRLKKSTATLHF